MFNLGKHQIILKNDQIKKIIGNWSPNKFRVLTIIRYISLQRYPPINNKDAESV